LPPAPREIVDACLSQRAEVLELFAQLADGSRDGEGVTRASYGAGEEFAHRLIGARAAAMGLTVARDHAANLMMTLPGSDRRAPRLVSGSHLDSVAIGGNYDGAAGVIAALVAIESLRRLGVAPRCDVTAIAIRAEESVWFEVSYIGSRAAFGLLSADALEAKRIDTGRTLAEHMAECGADVGAVRAGTASLAAADIRAFVELHIEQAPQLIAADLPMAVGTGVPGNFRYPSIRILGEYAHVGLPRRFRQDAVLAGSDFAMRLDAIWRTNEAEGRPMAFTIGRMTTDKDIHALTKVAGELTVSLDVRAYDAAHLAELERAVMALAADIGAQRGVRFELGARRSAEVAPSDPHVRAGLMASAEALKIPAMPLASPASHDTATFTRAGVPSAMLFVRNANGSHNPREAMDVADFLQAAAVLTHFVIGEATPAGQR
jgi:N-carbamoyl-L-amino-acid hydrolase